jgi:hypothetical protein
MRGANDHDAGGRRQPRPRRPSLLAIPVWLGLGLILIAVPLGLGASMLTTETPERAEPVSIGVVPPVPAERGRGFTFGTLVEVTACGDPAVVTVVAAPSAEYWIDRSRDFARWARFALAIPDASTGIRVGLGQSASDVLAVHEAPTPAPARRGRGGRLRIDRLRRTAELLVIEGAVRTWPATLAPLVVQYPVDWLEARGLGTCFLRLPALTGDLTVLTAQRAQGNHVPLGQFISTAPTDLRVFSKRADVEAAYDPRLEVSLGSTTVVGRDGMSVESGDSLPQPDSSVNGSPTWTCVSRAKRVATLSSLRDTVPELIVSDRLLAQTAGALSREALQRGVAGNCSAIVALNEASAGQKRDLLLLGIGALMSLGFALIVEAVLEAIRSRQREGSAHGG